jgi:membrane associated rhomboid family serine protease
MPDFTRRIFPSVPPALQTILIATVGVYILQIIPGVGSFMLDWGALVPRAVFGHGEVWRLVSYLFLHDPFDPLHLLFNMLSLWMFGAQLEEVWGGRRFTRFYFVCGAGAALFSILFWNAPIIGASGAVMAVMTAYAWHWPRQTILLFLIFPVPVWLAVVIFAAISLWFSFGNGGGIAHITHLGGILVALAYLKFGGSFDQWKNGAAARISRARQHSAEEERRKRENYFAEKIDPILKKISERGMDSLTAGERALLDEASKKNKEEFSARNMLPFRKKP